MEKFKLTNFNEREIQKANSRKIKTMAQELATGITLRFEECYNNIQSAKEAAAKAKNMEKGLIASIFDLASEEQANALAESDNLIIKAQEEILALQQETIKLICVSIAFAKEMNKEMCYILDKGTIRIKSLSKHQKLLSKLHNQLSEETLKGVKGLQKQAQIYINQQSRIEKLEKASGGSKLPYIMSTLSLLVSIITIVLFFMK